jgi:hypothetical protein
MSIELGKTAGRCLHCVEKHFQERSVELQIPPLRSPGFPVDLGGVGALHAPFPYRNAHTRPCPVQRGRKSGYAPAGMTKLRVALPLRVAIGMVATQIPPLRFAPVGMTKGGVTLPWKVWARSVSFPRRFVISTEAQRSAEACGCFFSRMGADAYHCFQGRGSFADGWGGVRPEGYTDLSSIRRTSRAGLV